MSNNPANLSRESRRILNDNPAAAGSAALRFTNEVGNEIVIEVVAPGPGNICRFSVAGPDSMVESYLTHMELTKLKDACVLALGTSEVAA